MAKNPSSLPGFNKNPLVRLGASPRCTNHVPMKRSCYDPAHGNTKQTLKCWIIFGARNFQTPEIHLIKRGDFFTPQLVEKISLMTSSFWGLFLHLLSFGSSLNRNAKTTFPASPMSDLISKVQPSELRIQRTFWDQKTF